MISVFFKRFSTLDRFYSSLAFEQSGFGYAPQRPVLQCFAHVWRTSLEPSYLHDERMKYFIFFFLSRLNWMNRGYASVCLLTESPCCCLYGNSIEMRGKRAHAILLMERCTRFGWESLLRTSPSHGLSFSLSDRYPLSDCLGIVTSVQSSSKRAPVR